ncbi:MAG: hypothetical protein AUJ98_01485 [Bacteroidetes bacterium CG2_30_33_31]|nr:MAG: hypothetical protein AUJ98_01485 [Bacteroidetes bacterium CG2_30_33_31]
MKYILFCSFFLLSISCFSQATNDSIQSNSRETAIKVFIDCGTCDMTYFRENFTLINYVRDRKVADVQVIVSTMKNGGGGNEFIVQFVGLGKYAHLLDTLVFNTKADDTADEIRQQQLKILKMGLIPYILKTPYASRINVDYSEEKMDLEEKDPWNHWVFNLGGHAWFNGEKSYKSMNIWTSASASRITEKIKYLTEVDMNYSKDRYRLYDGKDSLIYAADSHQKSYYFGHSTIWSLGEHWGTGISLDAWQSTFSNLDLALEVKPAIEYNFFKYSEASRKQLRLGYELGAVYRNYTDTTIYNKLDEMLLKQKAEINYKYITKWGSVRSGIYWQNYLRDFSLYSIGADLSLSVRLFKGVSINISGNANMPRDQIGLVKTEASSEDVLLRKYELKTQYSYFANIGISYTFGSIYNNVVNPRFE